MDKDSGGAGCFKASPAKVSAIAVAEIAPAATRIPMTIGVAVCLLVDTEILQGLVAPFF